MSCLEPPFGCVLGLWGGGGGGGGCCGCGCGCYCCGCYCQGCGCVVFLLGKKENEPGNQHNHVICWGWAWMTKKILIFSKSFEPTLNKSHDYLVAFCSCEKLGKLFLWILKPLKTYCTISNYSATMWLFWNFKKSQKFWKIEKKKNPGKKKIGCDMWWPNNSKWYSSLYT